MKRGRVSPRAMRQLLHETEREREKGRWVYVPELINPHNPSNCTVSTLSRSERACQPFCPRLSLSKFHYPLSPPPLPRQLNPTRSSPFSALASLSLSFSLHPSLYILLVLTFSTLVSTFNPPPLLASSTAAVDSRLFRVLTLPLPAETFS